MNTPEDQTTSVAKANADLEREVRRGRKFNLSEAIARLAGPGMMKGVSPISRKIQAEFEIENYLNSHLIDSADALRTILLRRVKQSDLLLNNYDQPLVVLAGCIHRALESEYLLTELVREADIEWGQMNGEKPYFEKEGCSPDPDDPYTHESVRSQLNRLIEKLSEDIA
jgi:hypothetical protein